MEKDLGLTGNQFQMAVSLLFVTYCVRFPSWTLSWIHK